MDRRYRLTGSADFQRVRRTGKAYAHPLVVLMTCPNGLDRSRFGITAGRRVGGAVVRNRAKRLLREAVRRHVDRIGPGWDIVLVARPGLLSARWPSLAEAVDQLIRQSGCLVSSNDDTD
jgi:ribonuclease P protein component